MDKVWTDHAKIEVYSHGQGKIINIPKTPVSSLFIDVMETTTYLEIDK